MMARLMLQLKELHAEIDRMTGCLFCFFFSPRSITTSSTFWVALGDHRGGPLGTWLDNLGREVRSAAVHRARSSRPMCLCT